MVSFRSIAPLAVVVGLIAATPAVAQPSAGVAPKAHAAGGDVVTLVYPSIVNVRLVRAEAALDRAAEYADEHEPDKAVVALTSGRRNLRAAWVAAKYVIDNAPPPVAADDAFHARAFSRSGRLQLRTSKTSRKSAHSRKSRRSHKATRSHRARRHATARAAQVATTPPNASIYDTAFAVLSLQHAYATQAFGLIDTAHGTLLGGLSTTIFTALNDRDAAIAYIHSIDTPPAAVEDSVARAAQEDAPPAWATVMPNATPMLDDEIQQIDGTLKDPGLKPGAQKVLNAAELQDAKTQSTLNAFWPPAPADD